MLRKALVLVIIVMLVTIVGIQQSPIGSVNAAEFISVDAINPGSIEFTYRGTIDDGGGRSDTYLVLDQVDVEGTTWFKIFIGDGSANVWVPADNVTVIE